MFSSATNCAASLRSLRRSDLPLARSQPVIFGEHSAWALKQKVRWDLYLLILRAIAMFFMAAHGLYFILVPLMALLRTYLEVWPERAIGAVFGDRSRLWEYDPGNPTSNRRPP